MGNERVLGNSEETIWGKSITWCLGTDMCWARKLGDQNAPLFTGSNKRPRLPSRVEEAEEEEEMLEESFTWFDINGPGSEQLLPLMDDFYFLK